MVTAVQKKMRVIQTKTGAKEKMINSQTSDTFLKLGQEGLQ